MPKISDAVNMRGNQPELERAFHEAAVSAMRPQTIATEPIGYRSMDGIARFARMTPNPHQSSDQTEGARPSCGTLPSHVER